MPSFTCGTAGMISPTRKISLLLAIHPRCANCELFCYFKTRRFTVPKFYGAPKIIYILILCPLS